MRTLLFVLFLLTPTSLIADENASTIEQCVRDAAYAAVEKDEDELKRFIAARMDFDTLAMRSLGNMRAWKFMHEDMKQGLREEARRTAFEVLPKRLPRLSPASIELDLENMRAVGGVYQVIGTAMSIEGEEGEIGVYVTIDESGSCTFHDLMVIGYWLSGMVDEWTVTKTGPD